MSDVRPVWLTRDQRRHLTQMGTLADRHGFPVLVEACDEIAAAWDAAPANPVQAALLGVEAEFMPGTVGNADLAKARAVLHALGMPS